MLRNCCFVNGVRIDQTDSEVDALFRFIAAKELYGFVELDIHEGGLALCLMKEMPRLHYLGITSNMNNVDSVIKLKTEKHRYTLLLEGDAISAEIVNKVNVWLVDRWPVLIYCDGNNKLMQLNLYRHLVRFGDFLGIHNYWNKSRIIPDLPDFPYGKLKPEILDIDLKYLKRDFQSVKFAPLINTRIAILQRRTK